MTLMSIYLYLSPLRTLVIECVVRAPIALQA